MQFSITYGMLHPQKYSLIKIYAGLYYNDTTYYFNSNIAKRYVNVISRRKIGDNVTQVTYECKQPITIKITKIATSLGKKTINSEITLNIANNENLIEVKCVDLVIFSGRASIVNNNTDFIINTIGLIENKKRILVK